MKTELEVTYYYILNKDLGMSNGKIAAQVSHVAMQLGLKYHVLGRAIICEANEDKLIEIADKLKDHSMRVYDAGLNEVPKGSLTCVGIFTPTRIKIKILKELELVK